MDRIDNVQKMQFQIGITMVAGILVLVFLIWLFAERNSLLGSQMTEVKIRFLNAPGVREGTEISRSGVLIGRVKKIELVDDSAIITALIDSQYRIRKDQKCQLNMNFLGDAKLSIIQVPNGIGKAEYYASDEQIEGMMEPTVLDMFASMNGRINGALDALKSTSEKLDRILTQVGMIYNENEGDIKDMMVQAKEMSKQAHQLLSQANELLSDPTVKEGIKGTIVQLPDTVKEARQTFAKLQTSMEKLDQVSTNVGTLTQNANTVMVNANKTVLDAQKSLAKADTAIANINTLTVKTGESLDNINKLTGPLAEQSGPWLTKFNDSLDNLDVVLGQLSEFSKSLNQSDGTVKRLIQDPSLYNNLNQTLADMKNLTGQLQPVIYNMQVFSDKIARNPEQLGVRGAMNRSSGTLGVPPVPATVQDEFYRYQHGQTVPSTAAGTGRTYGPSQAVQQTGQPAGQWTGTTASPPQGTRWQTSYTH